jgi:hypothetical protein
MRFHAFCCIFCSNMRKYVSPKSPTLNASQLIRTFGGRDVNSGSSGLRVRSGVQDGGEEVLQRHA